MFWVFGGLECFLCFFDDVFGVDDDDVVVFDDGGGWWCLVEDVEVCGVVGNGDEGGYGTRRGVRRAKMMMWDGWWMNVKCVRWC